MHTHRAIPGKAQERCWTHCTTPYQCAVDPQRAVAHGNIIRIDTCSCGAKRETEINGGRKNYGPWEAFDCYSTEDQLAKALKKEEY